MKPALYTLALAALFLAGCGSTPPSTLYVIEAQAPANVRTVTEGRRVEVVAVRIPDLWDRPQIVLSKPGGQVDFNEFNRWAVPLKSEVPRVVTRNLVSLLGSSTVWLREDFPGALPDVRVQVSIEQIEAVAGKDVRMEASWVVRGTQASAAIKVGRTSLREPLADASYGAVVSATNRTLLALSEQVARDIQAMPVAR
jgi:uncharacterized lipoprotein YmbA